MHCNHSCLIFPTNWSSLERMESTKRKRFIGIEVIKANIALVHHFICRLGTFGSTWVEKVAQTRGQEYKSNEVDIKSAIWNEKFGFDPEKYFDLQNVANLELQFTIFTKENPGSLCTFCFAYSNIA